MDWKENLKLASEKTGTTIAHVAAEHGLLPPDFDQWDLADKYGRTVADIIREKGLEDRYPSIPKKKAKGLASPAPGM
jgi:hypothetical protein